MTPPTRWTRSLSRARDLLEAAKDGYVFRARPEKDVRLLKRERDFTSGSDSHTSTRPR